MSKYNVGDEIEITVGDRKFVTIIDEQGVQRFKANTAIKAFVDASTAAYNEWIVSDRSTPEGFNLNTLAEEYYKGLHTLDDMLTLYTSFGYSVAGFADVSYFERLDIRNPLWEETHVKKISSAAVVELMALISEPFEHSGNEAVRYISDAVMAGRLTTDGKGNYVALGDTIDRVFFPFLETRGLDPWNITPNRDTSEELRNILDSWA